MVDQVYVNDTPDTLKHTCLCYLGTQTSLVNTFRCNEMNWALTLKIVLWKCTYQKTLTCFFRETQNLYGDNGTEFYKIELIFVAVSYHEFMLKCHKLLLKIIRMKGHNDDCLLWSIRHCGNHLLLWLWKKLFDKRCIV